MTSPFDSDPDSVPPWRHTLRRAGRRGGLTVADQVVASLGNFLTNILLARYLSGYQYGAFMVVFQSYLFLNAIQSAVVAYPMQIRVAVDHPQAGRLATASLILSTALWIPLGLAMAATIAVVFRAIDTPLPMAIVFGIAAMIAFQIQETFRRALTAQFRFGAALPGDAISYLGQVILIFMLAESGMLTLARAFAAMAATSALAALVQAIQVRPRRITLGELKQLSREYWAAGKWLLAASCSTTVTELSYSWLLGWRWGLVAVGHFQLLANFARAVNPLAFALASIIVPAVAARRAADGIRRAKLTGIRYSLAALAPLCIYLLTLELIPGTCLTLLYRQPEYSGYSLLLRIFTLTIFLGFCANAALAILNGLNESRASFWAQIANLVASILVGLPATYLYGTPGAVVGGLVVTLFYAQAAAWQFKRADGSADEPRVSSG